MRLLPHVHDYQMVFDRSTLDYKLRCSCRDVAPTQHAALRRTAESRTTAGLVLLAYAAVIGLAALVFWW